MLVAAGVFPHPPALVPQVAGQRAFELEGLRAACAEGLARLLRSRPDLLVVVGGAQHTVSYSWPVAGTLAPHGVDLEVGTGEAVLPLSLTIARWLLENHRGGPVPAFESVASDASPEKCLELGRCVAQRSQRVALMVMGDGSACRDTQAPGFHDPDAVPYDDHLARALGDGDVEALVALDPAMSERLLVSGRAAWQVLAGAARDRPVRGELLDYRSPYGVGYFVASWQLEPDRED
ncbi:hypothetical protein DFQ14_104108 [Halopolyspora algeriensis]|uniref:Catalytic LigB subunit of aromatic ring-opening dioxygenase n=1 Tax=Halopolyspora algeriensis TaxID=1500506 RepID=A0A368VS36_9ACTN|nr:class III extradiol dioxygenase subunit B-like domain-containing protein [Halopolyspora algeriensis]RCW44519.1 hypothetical protein DFQ14_104108 [Halopolyspora algeriensis]TQM55879.1 hypothetical protein FHU43_0657 [Halopolyspora algeriensis]